MKESEIRTRVEKLSTDERSLLVARINDLMAKPARDLHSENQRLVAYVAPNDEYEAEALKSYLQTTIPDYMVPSVIHLMPEIPKLPNGKTDRNALRAITEIPAKESSVIKPKTDLERQLVTIWEEVLQISPIGTNDNFFELGGDSILSIQLIAKARKLGIALSPNQLFENPTIDGVSKGILSSESKKLMQEEIISGEISLNPIQHWFFETHKSAPHFWNQACKISGFDFFTEVSVQNAAEVLIRQHDALRLTFKKTRGNWGATILQPEEVHPFTVIEISHLHLQEAIIAENLKYLQEGTSLTEGPLFRCIYFDTGNSTTDTVVLLAHHLVVDVVSWNIIIEQFLSAAKNSIASRTPDTGNIKTTSIKDWGDYLTKLVSENLLTNQVAYWKSQLKEGTNIPVDFSNEVAFYEENKATEDFKLDQKQTTALLIASNKAYHTKTEELLISALVDTIREWTAQEQVFIAMERNGRVTEKTQMDLSNTVGWFTAFYPLKFAAAISNNLPEKISQVKEKLRSVPDGGFGYGVLRYMGGDIDTGFFPQIIFNYVGNQGQSTPQIEFIETGLRHPKSEDPYFIEINAGIIDGELYFKWNYNTKRHKMQTVLSLVTILEQKLNDIIQGTPENDAIHYHTSDFPEAGLSQDDLNKLMGML